jgi:hypothetical protein
MPFFWLSSERDVSISPICHLQLLLPVSFGGLLPLGLLCRHVIFMRHASELFTRAGLQSCPCCLPLPRTPLVLLSCEFFFFFIYILKKFYVFFSFLSFLWLVVSLNCVWVIPVLARDFFVMASSSFLIVLSLLLNRLLMILFCYP